MKQEIISIQEYEFYKPDFKCEFNFVEHQGFIVGYVESSNTKFMKFWDKYGKCYTSEYDVDKRYNLTPVEKQWYEKESNIGKICVNTRTDIVINDRFFRMTKVSDYDCIGSDVEFNGYEDFVNIKHCRLATKEEILSLLGND